MSVRADPLVIGAVGGSGTRVFSRIARHAGVFMGEHVDAQEDSVPLSRFYGEFASEYLAADGRLDPPRTDELSRRLHDELPNSTWAETPGGHACLWEYPDAFNAAVLSFLGGVGGS